MSEQVRVESEHEGHPRISKNHHKTGHHLWLDWTVLQGFAVDNWSLVLFVRRLLLAPVWRLVVLFLKPS